jgi:CBS domain-containing protein
MRLNLANGRRPEARFRQRRWVMNVQALMKSNVKSAGTDASLAEVVAIMEANDCGAVPVVDQENKVVGMITDRDICLALGPRRLPAAGIAVTDVMSRKVYACGPGEDILEALETMGSKKVRRLPVIDGEGQLVGILSMDDIVLHAESGKAEKVEEKAELGYGRTVDTLKGIYERPGAEKELIAHP